MSNGKASGWTSRSGAHALSRLARPECGVMRPSTSVPSPFEAAHAPASHANDPYGEVLVGGIKTACLSRADLTRMMLTDCFAVSAENRRRASCKPISRHQRTCHRPGQVQAILPAALSESTDVIHADWARRRCSPKLFTGTADPRERSAPPTSFTTPPGRAAEHGLVRFFLLEANRRSQRGCAHPARPILRAPDRGPPTRLFFASGRGRYLRRDQKWDLTHSRDVIWAGRCR